MFLHKTYVGVLAAEAAAAEAAAAEADALVEPQPFDT
jgi:hypothetical protein